MKVLASTKLKHETVPQAYKENPQKLADELNLGMGFHEEGVKLDGGCFVANKSLRQAAKTLANAVIGKMAQGNLLSTTVYLRTQEELQALFDNPELEVKQVSIVGAGLLQVSVTPKSLLRKPNLQSQVILNAYITSYGRRFMDVHFRRIIQCGGKILYTDTDCGIFVLPKRIPNPLPLHFALYKAFKNELDEGATLVSFSSLGPKNYCLHVRLKDGSILKITRCRGFSLKHLSGENTLIDIPLMKKFLLALGDNRKECISIPQFRIQIDKSKLSLTSKCFRKIYSNMTLNKRMYDPRVCLQRSFPFGCTDFELK